MKEFWSKRVRDITPYTPGEQPKDRSLIKLNTNENPYPPSPMALKAIREAAGESLRLYPDPACTQLRDLAAQALGVKPEQIFVGNGSDEVLSLAFQAFFNPEEPVTLPDITYSFYQVFIDYLGLQANLVPLNDDFTLPVRRFLDSPRGGVVLANPNAPTGLAVPLSELRAIVEGNPDHVVLVDEAYVDFGAESAVCLVADHPNLLVVQTFSKGHSLAGLRVGFAIGNEDLIAALNAAKDSFNSYPVDRLAQAGAIGAIRDREYFHCTTQKIINTRSRTAAALRELGFTVTDSSANFLFITHQRVPARQLLSGLRERGVLVRWWDAPRIENYLRVTVGTDGEMQTLYQILKDLTA